MNGEINMEYELSLGGKSMVWTFGAMKRFERDSKNVLKRMDIRPLHVHTGHILANFGRIAEVLEIAVAASTGLSAQDGKKGEPSEASQAIDKYLDEGGSLEELQRAIYMAFLEKNDPSLIQPWLAEITRNEEVQRLNREKEEAKVEIARLELEDDQRKLEDLKKASGKLSTE